MATKAAVMPDLAMSNKLLAQLFLNGTAIVPKWGIVSVRPLQ
jgi:hypothetical protein